MTREVHISSLVVQVHPASMTAAMEAIETLPGVEIHDRDSLGKFVVVLEVESSSALSERMDQIQKMAGVLSASLVFHHVEDEPDAAAKTLAPQV